MKYLPGTYSAKDYASCYFTEEQKGNLQVRKTKLKWK